MSIPIFGCTEEARCSCPDQPRLEDVHPSGVHPDSGRGSWQGRCPRCGTLVRFETVNDDAPWAPAAMVEEVAIALARGAVVIRSGLSVGTYRRATDPGDHVGFAVLDAKGAILAEAPDWFGAARAFVLAELARSDAAREAAWRCTYASAPA